VTFDFERQHNWFFLRLPIVSRRHAENQPWKGQTVCVFFRSSSKLEPIVQDNVRGVVIVDMFSFVAVSVFLCSVVKSGTVRLRRLIGRQCVVRTQ
jgi:hypothetical protein